MPKHAAERKLFQFTNHDLMKHEFMDLNDSQFLLMHIKQLHSPNEK